MKRMLFYVAVATATTLTACGASEEETNQKIENAAKMRADQVCQGDGSLEQYGQKLDYLLEQLNEEGISDEASTNKATKLYDEKIKASCPDKMPE